MRLVYSGGGTTEVDVCERCKVAWFERGEADLSHPETPRFGSLPARAPTGGAPRKRAVGDEGSGIEFVEAEWDDVPLSWLGLPDETNEYVTKSYHPWVTPSFMVVGVVLTLGSLKNLPWAIQRLGFFPAEPLRHFGVPLIMATFLHSGWEHLVSNMYFLWLFGDDVETVIGPLGMAEVFLGGALFGHVVVALSGQFNGEVFIGASGGIMALASFYALTFPRAKLGIGWFLPYGWAIRSYLIKVRVPVTLAVAGYFTIDCLGVAMQWTRFLQLVPHVGYLSHITGAVFGALYWQFNRVRK